jgi:hypothetical protein
MAEIHFRLIEAPQNKSDVTDGFGDRDFVLAVCTCYIRKCFRFDVIRDFRSLSHSGNPFPIDKSTAEQK